MIIEASDGYIFLALHGSLIKLQSWNLVFVEVRKSCRLVSVLMCCLMNLSILLILIFSF